MIKFRYIIGLLFLGLTLNLFGQRKGEEEKEKSTIQTQDVIWDQLHGVVYDEKAKRLIVEKGKSGWGNSGAFSKQELPEGKNGFLEFSVQDENTSMAIGFAMESDGKYSPESIHRGFLITEQRILLIDKHEVVGEFGRFRVGDRFRIERRHEDILYFYNDIDIYHANDDPNVRVLTHLVFETDYVHVDHILISHEWEYEHVPDPVPLCGVNENDYNWVETQTLDLNGNLTSKSKIFYDRLGKVLQTQSLNIEEKTVFASQPVYDEYGRPVLKTMSAPIKKNFFCYDPLFIQNENDEAYTFNDFDKSVTSSDADGEVNNPKEVDDDIAGRLGWYYSNNNSDEAFVATTDFPYSRVEYSKANPGHVRRTSAPGNKLRMGIGHESEQYVMPASTELYYVYGYNTDWNTSDFDGIGNYTPIPINLDYQVTKSISVDQDEKEYVSFTDHDGKTLATCRSGLSEALQTVTSVIPHKGHIDIHVPNHCQSGLMIHYPSNASSTGLSFKILNLQTDKYVGGGLGTIYTSGQQPNLTSGYYRFEHFGGSNYLGTTISYQLNYERFTLHYYDQGKRLIKTIPPLGIDTDFNPSATATSLNEYVDVEDLPSNGVIQIDQPSNLSSIDNQMAHISLWGSNVSPIDPYDTDVVSSGGSGGLALRMANLSTERQNTLKRVKQLPGGINGSGVIAFMAQSELMAAPMINNYMNEVYSADLINVQNVIAVPYEDIPIGTGGTGGSGSFTPQQTFCKYTITYDLGYRDDVGVFHSVKDDLELVMVKNYKHTPTPHMTSPHGNNNVMYTYTNNENSAIILPEHFGDDLSEYEAQITNVDKLHFGYNAPSSSGPSLQPYLGFTQSINVSQLASETYAENFTLKLKVSNASQMGVPDHKMEQTYNYNSLNWLLSTETKDEGKSHFVYRNDGQIRFSQSARQSEIGSFSYTNYDKHARPIESGEYKGDITNYIFIDHYGINTNTNGATGNSVHDIREVTGGFAVVGDNCGDCFNRSYINYDIPCADIPTVPGGETYKQTFVNKSITKTANDQVSSWYSYDHYGRLTWLIKEYNDSDIPADERVKVWEYTYDSGNGSLLNVEYMPNTSEQYIHNYEYDANGRLDRVLTGTDGDVEQAQYEYYMHGPLKRTELGESLQGIDYVYTVNGALKSINNPSGIKHTPFDPGKDGIIKGGKTKDTKRGECQKWR